MSLKRETVERFPESATPEEKAKFAKDLIAALTKVGVGPGDDFEVIPTGELDEELQRIGGELEQAESEARDTKDLEEWVEDVERGILTFPELLQKVREW